MCPSTKVYFFPITCLWAPQGRQIYWKKIIINSFVTAMWANVIQFYKTVDVCTFFKIHFTVFYRERWISLPSYSLVSWAMTKIQPWIAGRANKQFCTQAIEKKIYRCLKKIIITYQCSCVQSWNLAHFIRHEFFHPTRYSWQSIYISVLGNEGVFTGKDYP